VSSDIGPARPGSVGDDVALRDSLVRISAGVVGLIAMLDPLAAPHAGRVGQRVDEHLQALRRALEEAERLRRPQPAGRPSWTQPQLPGRTGG
jgi:hypothetical protein